MPSGLRQLVDAKLAYIPESYETMPGGQDLRLDWCTPPSPESFQDLCYGWYPGCLPVTHLCRKRIRLPTQMKTSHPQGRHVW